MHVRLKDVSIKFPIYDAKQKSIKQTALSLLTGGRIIGSSKFVEVVALNSINLNLNDGDRVALMGHNGSGKTTLLRTVAGVYRPTSGSVCVKGEITSLLDMLLGVELDATGYENIYLRSLFLGIRHEQIEPLINNIIDFSELGRYIHMPVRTYSSGMTLRLAFSICTAIQPEILLMDEWISVGDKSFLEKSRHRINQLLDSTKILILATHDDQLAKKFCNKIIKMEKGEIKSPSIRMK